MDIKVPYQRVQRDLINKGEFVTMFLAIKKKKKKRLIVSHLHRGFVVLFFPLKRSTFPLDGAVHVDHCVGSGRFADLKVHGSPSTIH